MNSDSVAEASEEKDITFFCGMCGNSLVVAREGAGVKVPCPVCHVTLTIPEESQVLPEDESPSRVANPNHTEDSTDSGTPMSQIQVDRLAEAILERAKNPGLPTPELIEREDGSTDISFHCGSCRTHLVVDKRGGGLTISCPSCAKPLRIPDPNQAELFLSDALAASLARAARERKVQEHKELTKLRQERERRLLSVTRIPIKPRKPPRRGEVVGGESTEEEDGEAEGERAHRALKPPHRFTSRAGLSGEDSRALRKRFKKRNSSLPARLRSTASASAVGRDSEEAESVEVEDVSIEPSDSLGSPPQNETPAAEPESATVSPIALSGETPRARSTPVPLAEASRTLQTSADSQPPSSRRPPRGMLVISKQTLAICIVIGLAVVGIIFWVISAAMTSQLEQKIAAEADEKAKEKAAAEVQAEAERDSIMTSFDEIEVPQEELDVIQAVIREYASASTWQDTIDLIRDPLRVTTLMASYYKENEYEPIPIHEIRIERVGKLEDTKVALCVVVEDDNFLQHGFVLEKVDNTYKIDWETLVEFNPYTWEEFKDERPSKPTPMRVNIFPDNYYNYLFSDREEYQSFKLFNSRSEFIGIHAFLKRESEAYKQMETVDFSIPFSCIVTLKYPQGSEDSTTVELVEFVQAGWLVR